MRIVFNNDIKTKSGKCFLTGDTVFKSRENDTICIQRKFTYPRITEINKTKGKVFKAAVKIWKDVSNEFKEDLNEYARLYNLQHKNKNKISLSGYNIYLKVLCQIDDPMDSIDSVVACFGNTINLWIFRNYLQPVKTNHSFKAKLYDN